MNRSSIFAHLGRSAKSKAEDDEDDKSPKDKRDDEEAEKARKAKRKAKGEDDDDDEDDDEDSKKDKDDEKDAKASATRGRERDRVRAILTSGPGLANPVAAAYMALDTGMSRGSAISALGSLNAAMGVPDYDPAEDARGEGVSPMAAAIIAAGAKARGETPRMPGQRERMSVRADAPPPPPRPQDMAARIIAAGAKARGETSPDLPRDPAARAMVEADRRRRGEI